MVLLALRVFFVVIVSHIGLRSSIAVQGVIYIESFYFVMYGAILSISATAIMASSGADLGFIRYKDGLISRLLYWPVLLGILFVVTLLAFT